MIHEGGYEDRAHGRARLAERSALHAWGRQEDTAGGGGGGGGGDGV